MFGIYKKLKDGFHKVRKFISDKVIKKAKPMLEKIDLNQLKPLVPSKYQPNLDKLDNFKNKVIDISDDVINLDEKLKNKDYSGAIEYAGHTFIPRLKRK